MGAAAGAVRERLRHEGRDHAVFVRDLAHRHFHEGEVIGRLQRLIVGEVDLELAVAVLVIYLVDIDTRRPQAAHHLVQRLAGPVQAFIVVARLVQIVGRIRRTQRAVGRAAQQHEFRLYAGEHRQAALGQPGNLVLQRHTGTKCIRLLVHDTVADEPCISRHPGNVLQRRDLADGHIVGTFGAHAETPQREAGETRTVRQHHVQVLDRHGLGLRGAVDVDELRQDVAGVVLLEERGRLLSIHTPASIGC